MTRTARLTLFHGPGQPLSVAGQPVPAPRGAEILVRVTACSICSSDVHTFTGRRPVPTPTVLGHEIVGRIEEMGPEVSADVVGQTIRPGDRITWSIAASCGRCFFCTHELPQKCATLFKYGHEPFGAGHAFSGGLADVCVLAPGTAVV